MIEYRNATFHPVIRKLLVGSLIVLLVLLGGAGVLLQTHGVKPSSAWADPAKLFSFAAIRDKHELAQSLRENISRGATRSHVERLLVEQAGATLREEPGAHQVQYLHRREPQIGPDDLWTVAVLYDSDDRVHQVWLSGVGALLPETPPERRGDNTVFRFEDYGSADDLLETLRMLFPIDTPRSNVEHILVELQGAQLLLAPNSSQLAIYQKTIDESRGEQYLWNIKIEYLSDDRVSQIYVARASMLKAYTHDREYFLKHK